MPQGQHEGVSRVGVGEGMREEWVCEGTPFQGGLNVARRAVLCVGGKVRQQMSCRCCVQGEDRAEAILGTATADCGRAQHHRH